MTADRLGFPDRRVADRLPSRVVLRCGARAYFVRPDEIDWIEAAGNYSTVHASGNQLLVRESIGPLVARLSPLVVRIHRSIAVNPDRVLEIRRLGRRTWTAVLRNGERVPISAEMKKELELSLVGE